MCCELLRRGIISNLLSSPQLVVELCNLGGRELRPRMRRPFKMGENPRCFQPHLRSEIGLRLFRYPGGIWHSFVTNANLRNKRQKQSLNPCLSNKCSGKERKIKKISQSCLFFKMYGVPGGVNRNVGEGKQGSPQPQR